MDTTKVKLEADVLNDPQTDHQAGDIEDDDVDYKMETLSACLFVLAPADIKPEIESTPDAMDPPLDVGITTVNYKQQIF